MNLPSWSGPARDALPLATLCLALLHALAARRSEQLFERVQDLNRERLNVLERELDAGSGRSRMEALSMQLDAGAQSAVSARQLALRMLPLLGAVASASIAGAITGLPQSPLPFALEIAWLLGAVLGALWMEGDLRRSAGAAEESTAHARRYEFLYVSEMRKKM